MAMIWVPSLLQGLTGGKEQVVVPGATLRQVITNLDSVYPGIKDRLLRDEGRFQEGIAVSVDGEVVTMGLLERVKENSEVHIIPAIGGGVSDQQFGSH